MSVCTFDQLLYAIRTSVQAANQALWQRRLKHCVDGDTRMQSLHVELLSNKGADAPPEPLVIPLRAFRDSRVPQIAELSVAFDCYLRVKRLRGKEDEFAVVMRRPWRPWLSRPRMHHINLSFSAVDQWQPRVEFDGHVITALAAKPE